MRSRTPVTVDLHGQREEVIIIKYDFGDGSVEFLGKEGERTVS
jgi:hypothetical protein